MAYGCILGMCHVFLPWGHGLSVYFLGFAWLLWCSFLSPALGIYKVCRPAWRWSTGDHVGRRRHRKSATWRPTRGNCMQATHTHWSTYTSQRRHSCSFPELGIGKCGTLEKSTSKIVSRINANLRWLDFADFLAVLHTCLYYLDTLYILWMRASG